MTRNDKIDHDDLWSLAARWLPVFSLAEQHAGILLLRELAKGEAVACNQLAQAVGTSPAAAEALVKESALRPIIHTDEEDRIIGFWGLSVVPTHHQIKVNGRPLWTTAMVSSAEPRSDTVAMMPTSSGLKPSASR